MSTLPAHRRVLAAARGDYFWNVIAIFPHEPGMLGPAHLAGGNRNLITSRMAYPSLYKVSIGVSNE